VVADSIVTNGFGDFNPLPPEMASREQPLPETSRLCREVISLPMSAETTPEHVEIVAESIRTFLARR
jgi:dTDP-4-amino-4,6-dideoxygalactose transaminase